MKENRILQIKVWEDCDNGCSFCYLNKNRICTSIEEKRERLVRMKHILTEKGPSYKKVGLIGGEFFQGQLRNLLAEWSDVLDVLNTLDLDQIWIAATLTTEDLTPLMYTLQYLSQTKVLICTSWDAVGRFTKESRKIWKENIEFLHTLGYNINVTSIITQDLLEADQQGLFDIPNYCRVNLSDPYLSLEWYNTVDKKNYREHLLKENKSFRLPKRADFIAFLKKHPDILRNYANYSDTHSDDIVDLDGRAMEMFCCGRCDRGNSFAINPECGHPYFSQCYCDSDRCAMCDAKNLLEAI